MHALPNGIYDIFVIDVEELDDGSVRYELAVTAGDYKGDVIAVRASHARHDALACIGLPGTLRVVDGVPRVELDE